jgi:hypothetical protein
MSSPDLNGMQHYGGMNCRLAGVAKENKESKSGIGWLKK